MYNPQIMGFNYDDGSIRLPVQGAKELYGDYPSKYNAIRLPHPETRRANKTLNLPLGPTIRHLLQNKGASLERHVFDSYVDWHRNYLKEFGINIEALHNIHKYQDIVDALRDNSDFLLEAERLDIKQALLENGFIPKSTLNSMRQGELAFVEKVLERLNNKRPQDPKKLAALHHFYNLVLAKQELIRLSQTTAKTLSDLDESERSFFSDHIYQTLTSIAQGQRPSEKQLDFSDKPNAAHPHIHFEYAKRDKSFLQLGSDFGDCTAIVKPRQGDASIENIFWTVFAWILDPHYRILKVFFQNEALLKVHLLPLYYLDEQNQAQFFLCVDAIETTTDKGQAKQVDTLPHCQEAFDATITYIRELAKDLNIRHIIAERFSNTPWVRQAFDDYPEIYLDTHRIRKIDDLEDIYESANLLLEGQDIPNLNALFIEIQATNTFLLSGDNVSKGSIKNFALIAGSPELGIPMGKIIGV